VIHEGTEVSLPPLLSDGTSVVVTLGPATVTEKYPRNDRARPNPASRTKGDSGNHTRGTSAIECPLSCVQQPPISLPKYTEEPEDDEQGERNAQ